MTPAPGPHPELLPREAAQVHRLARAVVRDAHRAADVAQDALLVALRRPPRGESNPSVLRVWLARVVHSLAARSRRDAQVRARHELAAARPVERECEARIAVRLQQQRNLLAAVTALPELYRTAVTMRFLDGMSPRAMAAALAVDPATVRQRVHRGLVMLRARLERHSGSARASVSALLASRAPLAGPLFWIGSIMALKKVAACLVVAAVGVLWVARPWEVPPAAARDAPVASVAPASVTAGAQDVRSDRTEVPVPSSSRTGAASGAAATAATGTLVVRVRVQAGPVLAGAPVTVSRRRSSSRNDDPDAREGTTDGDGQVRFAELQPGPWAVVVDGRGKPGRVVVEAGRVVEHEVAVPTGFTVGGMVVDDAGNAVPEARVVSGTAVMAVSGANGAFRLEHVQGPLLLRARAPGRVPSAEAAVTGADGATTSVELRLGGAGRRIEGRVLLVDGSPAANAKVALVPQSARERSRWDPQSGIEWARTDAAGRFQSDELPAEPHVVVAQAREPEVPPCWAEADPTPGQAFVELQSVAAARLRGVVVRGTDGVAGAELVCWPDRTANAVARVVGDLGLRLERCGADGTFELRGLVEGVVTVRVLEGGGVAKVEEIAVVAGAVRDCRIELGPRSELRIEVRGVVSKELVAMVKTAGAPADDFGGLVALGDGRTGRWEGPRSEPSDVYLAWMDNKRDMVQLAMARAVPVDQHAVVFEISADQLPGGSLRGRLVDRSLGAVPSLVLSAHRVDGGGLVVRRLAITDTVGAFAIGPLPPGEYELRSSTAAGPPPRVLARVSLAAGRDEQLGDVVVAPETGR